MIELLFLGTLVLYDQFSPIVFFVAAWAAVICVMLAIAVVVNGITHAIDPR